MHFFSHNFTYKLEITELELFCRMARRGIVKVEGYKLRAHGTLATVHALHVQIEL